MQAPCILSDGSRIAFPVLQGSLNIFLNALQGIVKFLSSCHYKSSLSIKTFGTYFLSQDLILAFFAYFFF